MSPGNGKVCLAYTFFDSKIHVATMESIIGFLNYDGSEKGRALVTDGGRVFGGTSAYIPDARNAMVRRFLKGDQEWLLQLDWDIAFRPEHVYQLLDAAVESKAKIMGGLYFVMLDNQICPVFFDKEKNGKFRIMPEFQTNEVYELASTGMGFTLIHREVFEKMERKFRGPWHWYAHDHTGDDICGEDITFCRRAKKVGYPTYGYTGVVVKHQKYHWLDLGAFGSDKNVEVDSGEA